MLIARIERQDPAEKRNDPRSEIGMRSTARDADDTAFDVEISDFSASGLAFVSEAAWPIGSRIVVGLVGAGRIGAKIVRRAGSLHGCAFDHLLTAEEVDRAFSSDQLATLNLGHEPSLSPRSFDAQRDVKKLPLAARVAVIGSTSTLLWAAILALYFA
jgi:hypothetical protein